MGRVAERLEHRSAPSGSPLRLRSPTSALTSASRRSGRARRRAGRRTRTRSGCRARRPRLALTLTGTIAFSLSGASPRRSKKRRTPPEATASTTSLTVASKRPLMRFRSASGRLRTREVPARRDRLVEARLRVADRSESASARAPCRPSLATSDHPRGIRASPSGPPAPPPPPRGRGRSSPSTSSRAPPGGVAGLQSSLSGAGGSGVGSSSSVASSTAARPSTIAWCALPITPIRPSGSRSAIHSSHNGDRGRAASTSPRRRARRSRGCRCGARGARCRTRVVDPHRVVHPERNRRQLLAVTRRAAHPAGQVLAQLLERGRFGRAAPRSAQPSPRACAPMGSPPPGRRRPAASVGYRTSLSLLRALPGCLRAKRCAVCNAH